METFNQLRKKLNYFSGEDRNIIAICPTTLQWRFAWIGTCVIFIFIGCFVSATSFMYSLFEGVKWISIPLGIIWALIVTNIYLFLLYTISPTILPTAKKRKKRVLSESEQRKLKKEHALTPSMLFRMGFMLILAIIVAQPLNVLFFSSWIESTMANFRDEYRVSMLIVSDSSVIRQELFSQRLFEQAVLTKATPHDSARIAQNTYFLNEKVIEDQRFLQTSQTLLNELRTTPDLRRKDSLRNELRRTITASLASDQAFLLKIKNIRFQDASFRDEFERYRSNMVSLIAHKLHNYSVLEDLLDSSNFYIRHIQVILKEVVFARLVTAIVCVLFLLPIFFKFRVRNHTAFYEHKRKKEEQFVRESYNAFKRQYTQLFDYKLRLYTEETKARLAPYLEKLMLIRADLADQYRLQIEREITPEPVHKYEYWADPPFRHQHRKDDRVIRSEQELLRRIYPD